ncbi:hypothetical protein AVEN_176091-1 [Araneus ventricosus]|uniref:Uncharacterized protein n=1 Tax=Araneus ventricosus TaxID=182803 RepID=A0A4Y2RYK6_ARAVE|nr:hypothetical protein AVEN_176091-1 [Araneus ventricosus]
MVTLVTPEDITAQCRIGCSASLARALTRPSCASGRTPKADTHYCITASRKTLDTRHACDGRYGNGIFHSILGVKERALFHLAQIEPTEVSFRFVLRSKTNSSPKFAKCCG